MRGKAVIAGIGHTAFGKQPGRSTVSLNIEACRKAVADAGIEKDAIDGLLVKVPTSKVEMMYGQKLAEAMGMSPRVGGVFDQGGASNISMIAIAAMAIEAGQCEVALVTLAELTAIGFSGPLFICLGAVLFLGERMSGARWTAVLLGFVGVLLVVKPWEGEGFAGISTGMLLMLASAPVFAGSFLVAKALTRHDRSEVVVLWQHLWVSVLLVPFALAYWANPSPAQWALLVLCGFRATVVLDQMNRASSRQS